MIPVERDFVNAAKLQGLHIDVVREKLWADLRPSAKTVVNRLIAALNRTRCDIPVFWGYDQAVHSAIVDSKEGVGNVQHYLLMETPYYAPRRPNPPGQYGRKMHPSGYLSLGFDGLQGRSLQ